MSADAGNDLFEAVRAALIGDAFVNGKVVGRVFSSWGNKATLPLIRMRLGRTVRFEIDGPAGTLDGSETDFSVHVFTKEPAPIIGRQITSKVRDLLQDATPALAGSEVVALQYIDDLPPQSDPDDPNLQMCIVRFRAQTTSK